MRSMIDRYKLQSLRLSSPFPVFFSRLRQDRYPHWRGTRVAPPSLVLASTPGGASTARCRWASPNEPAEKILRHSGALGGVS